MKSFHKQDVYKNLGYIHIYMKLHCKEIPNTPKKGSLYKFKGFYYFWDLPILFKKIIFGHTVQCCKNCLEGEFMAANMKEKNT